MARKTGPQMGISVEPCAGVDEPPPSNWRTDPTGNLPPLLFESCVRSVGLALSAAAAGPPPLPSLPYRPRAAGQVPAQAPGDPRALRTARRGNLRPHHRRARYPQPPPLSLLSSRQARSWPKTGQPYAVAETGASEQPVPLTTWCTVARAPGERLA